MHLRTLRLFCDAVAQRSFSKAAELNGVSQSLVSQAVTSLENRLEIRLIDRSKRPLEPTRAGQVYADGSREMLDGFRTLEDSLLRLSDKVSGTVRVAAIYSVGLLEMGRFAQEFTREYPDVNLRMEYLRPEQVYERIRSDEAEIGIVSFPREGGEFRSREWQQQEVVCVTAPQGPLAGKRSVSPSQLEGRDTVALTRDLTFRRKLDRWLKSASVSVNVVHEFDNVENIKRSVEIGSGIAFLPLQTVQREIEYGSLRAVSLRGVTWKRSLGIVQKRNRKLTIAAARFTDFLLGRKPTRSKRTANTRGGKETPHMLAD